MRTQRTNDSGDGVERERESREFGIQTHLSAMSPVFLFLLPFFTRRFFRFMAHSDKFLVKRSEEMT